MTNRKETFQYSLACKLSENQYEAEKGFDMSFLDTIQPIKDQNVDSIESKELKNEINSSVSFQSLEFFQTSNKYEQSESQLGEKEEVQIFNDTTQLLKLNNDSVEFANQNIILASNSEDINQPSKAKRKRRGKRGKNKGRSDLHWLSDYPNNETEEDEFDALYNCSNEIEPIILDMEHQIESSSMELEPVTVCSNIEVAEHSVRKVINQENELNSDESDIDIDFKTFIKNVF